MRSIAVTVLISGFCVALGVSNVAGQSLGDLAKSEKERRKGESKRVLTEEDLAKRSGSARSAAAPSEDGGTAESGAAAASPSPKPTEKSDEEQREAARKSWEERQKRAQDEVDQLTKQVEDIQQGLGDARSTQLGSSRQRVATRLEEAQTKLAAAQQRLDDLEEERRREGF